MITKLKAIMEMNSEMDHLRQRVDTLCSLLTTTPADSVSATSTGLTNASLETSKAVRGMFETVKEITTHEINNLEGINHSVQLRTHKYTLANFSPFFQCIEGAIAMFDDMEEHFDDYDDIGNNYERCEACSEIIRSLKELDNLMKQILVSKDFLAGLEEKEPDPSGKGDIPAHILSTMSVLEELLDFLSPTQGIKKEDEKKTMIIAIMEDETINNRCAKCEYKQFCAEEMMLLMSCDCPGCWSCENINECLAKHLKTKHGNKENVFIFKKDCPHGDKFSKKPEGSYSCGNAKDPNHVCTCACGNSSAYCSKN